MRRAFFNIDLAITFLVLFVAFVFLTAPYWVPRHDVNIPPHGSAEIAVVSAPEPCAPVLHRGSQDRGNVLPEPIFETSIPEPLPLHGKLHGSE